MFCCTGRAGECAPRARSRCPPSHFPGNLSVAHIFPIVLGAALFDGKDKSMVWTLSLIQTGYSLAGMSVTERSSARGGSASLPERTFTSAMT